MTRTRTAFVDLGADVAAAPGWISAAGLWLRGGSTSWVNAVLALHFAHELAVPGTQALDASMLAVFVALVVVET
jgi:hypothetical protein